MKAKIARWLLEAFMVLAAKVENICTIKIMALKQRLLAEFHKCIIKYKNLHGRDLCKNSPVKMHDTGLMKCFYTGVKKHLCVSVMSLKGNSISLSL